MNYWSITLWDGEKVRVSPKNAEFIKQKLASGEGHIITKTRTIAVKDIKSFEETDELYTPPEKRLASGVLIEQAAQAFNEPILNDTSVAWKWVKKQVPRRKHTTYYSQHQGVYRDLYTDENYVTVAFRQPIHQIDTTKVQECDANDLRVLTRT